LGEPERPLTLSCFSSSFFPFEDPHCCVHLSALNM
jgi:hypothetical protein